MGGGGTEKRDCAKLFVLLCSESGVLCDEGQIDVWAPGWDVGLLSTLFVYFPPEGRTGSSRTTSDEEDEALELLCRLFLSLFERESLGA